jgi:hypothetical protein
MGLVVKDEYYKPKAGNKQQLGDCRSSNEEEVDRYIVGGGGGRLPLLPSLYNAR